MVTKFSYETTAHIFGENHLLSSIDSPEENYLYTDNDDHGSGQAIKPEKEMDNSVEIQPAVSLDALQRSLTSLELPRALPVANIRYSLHIEAPAPSIQNTSDTSNQNYQDKIFGGLKHGGVQNERLRDPACEILIHGLEKFSMVTKFSRETTSHIFGENRLLSDSPEENYLHTYNSEHGSGQAIKPEKEMDNSIESQPDVSLDALQRSLTPLELPGALPVANIRSSLHIEAPAAPIQNTADTSNQSYQDKIFGGLKHGGVQNERLRDPAREILIHGLEKFSMATKFARGTTTHIFGENRLLSSIDSPEENYLHTDNGEHGSGQAIKP